MFDMAVNMGMSNAVKVLQRTLNRYGNNLTVDGLIGNKTHNALRAAPTEVVYMIALERLLYYNNFAISRPAQLTFLRGWGNRTMDILLRSTQSEVQIECLPNETITEAPMETLEEAITEDETTVTINVTKKPELTITLNFK